MSDDCSLPYVNNADCHSRIRAGGCPGSVERGCVNTNALAALADKPRVTRDETRAHGWVGCGHFVDQGDQIPRETKARQAVDSTQSHVVLFMRRVARRARERQTAA